MTESLREARDHWQKPRRVARIWWCGDDYCDCQQAEVVDISPGDRFPFIKTVPVAKGTFFTDGEGYDIAKAERDQLALILGAEVEGMSE